MTNKAVKSDSRATTRDFGVRKRNSRSVSVIRELGRATGEQQHGKVDPVKDRVKSVLHTVGPRQEGQQKKHWSHEW